MLKANKVLNKLLNKANKRDTGQYFEDKALSYLKQKGLKLKARNVNFPTGEIDLIMTDENQLVFVEVRFRQHTEFGGAAASVDYRKQTKLIKTAQLYLQKQFGNQPPSCRFDVIAIKGDINNYQVDWIKNAIS